MSMGKLSRVINFYSVVRWHTPKLFHTMRSYRMLSHCRSLYLSNIGSKAVAPSMLSIKPTLGIVPSGTVGTFAPVGRVLKTHSCNCLRASDVGSFVKLRGFVAFNRSKFIVLRDCYGVTQVHVPESHAIYKHLRDIPYESYVEVEGVVKLRPPEQVRSNIDTGEIEVECSQLKVLNAVKDRLPFLIREHNEPTELMGLQYRYLQLRYPNMQQYLRLRSDVSEKMSHYLQDIEGFVNVRTPTLAGQVSEGAHGFVVSYTGNRSSAQDKEGVQPSDRLYYTLAQSPQTYKQLLMAAGLDRYYQFAMCYRDETGRPDRQPEFEQVDIEACDVTALEIQRLVERLLLASWPQQRCGAPPSAPFPYLTYSEAMNRYGSDKPDTRFDWLLHDVSRIVLEGSPAESLTAPLKYDSETCSARALVVPDGRRFISRTVMEEWKSLAWREHSLPGLLKLTVEAPPPDGLQDVPTIKGAHSHSFSDQAVAKLTYELNAKPGDAIIMAVGDTHQVLPLLGKLRLLAASIVEACGTFVRDHKKFACLWIVDFPLFEPHSESEGRLQSVHHIFTRPHPEDFELLSCDPLKVRSQHYDLVCNGSEIASGSVRVHEVELQRRLMEMCEMPLPEMEYFLRALSLGTPPHAGIAIGFDRLMALFCGTQNIKDVIAFPKNNQGRCPMVGTPSILNEETRKHLGW